MHVSTHVVDEISIHAPREGCDVHGGRHLVQRGISIHAPREGCDCTSSMRTGMTRYFNPRTP